MWAIFIGLFTTHVSSNFDARKPEQNKRIYRMLELARENENFPSKWNASDSIFEIVFFFEITFSWEINLLDLFFIAWCIFRRISISKWEFFSASLIIYSFPSYYKFNNSYNTLYYDTFLLGLKIVSFCSKDYFHK